MDAGDRVVEVGLRDEVLRAHGDRDHRCVCSEPAVRLLELLMTLGKGRELTLELLLSHDFGVYPLRGHFIPRAWLDPTAAGLITICPPEMMPLLLGGRTSSSP